MKLRIISGILLLACLVVVACRTKVSQQKPEEKTDRPVTLPRTVRPLPYNDSLLVMPKAELLPEVDGSRKNITSTFGAADGEHIKARDRKLFANSDEEIIYLSRIKSYHYAFPLPGAKMISPYGGNRKNHSGTDLKTCANDTIVSVFDGVVRMAKPYAAYGNVVVVRHYNGLETVYSHNSKNLVKPGDEVRVGQSIALTGRTGRATTEHLHFEVRINGTAFNPDLLFDFSTRTLRGKDLLCRRKGSAIVVSPTEVLPHQLMSGYVHPETPLLFFQTTESPVWALPDRS